MKRVRVVFEGAADAPCDALDGRTPLEAAALPEANALAKAGRGGLFDFTAHKRTYRPAERLALMLGVEPAVAQTLEAGPIALFARRGDPEDIRFVYRVSLVTLDEHLLAAPRIPGITEEETAALVETLSPLWEKSGFELMDFLPGQFLACHRKPPKEFKTGMPPIVAYHEPWTGRHPLGLRSKDGSALLHATHDLLAGHEVNQIRLDLNENPANGVWLWGGGDPSHAWSMRTPGAGIIMSQNPTALGLARWLDVDAVEMEDPWLAMEGKKPGFRIARVVERLREHDDLLVYVGSPEHWGWFGARPQDKARGLKMLDRFVLNPLMSLLEAYRPFRILLTADGVMSAEEDHPLEGGVPFVMAGEQIDPDELISWSERACAHGALGRCKPAKVNALFERTA